MLVGGVGERYLRPFSLISNTAQVLTFHQDQLVSIKRVKLNGLLTANLSQPLRSKGGAPLLAIRTAQNRRITTAKAQCNAQGLTFMGHHLRYCPAEQRVVSCKSYELALREDEPDNDWSTLTREYEHLAFEPSLQAADYLLHGGTPERHFNIGLKLAYQLDEEMR